MKKQSGFTLIELMVVMAIIAILATAGLSAYTGYIKKARDTKRIADMSVMRTVMAGENIDWNITGADPLIQFGTKAQKFFNDVKDINNGQHLVDPLVGKPTGDSYDIVYGYYLIPCGTYNPSLFLTTVTGYILGAKLEAQGNNSLTKPWIESSFPIYIADSYNCTAIPTTYGAGPNFSYMPNKNSLSVSNVTFGGW